MHQKLEELINLCRRPTIDLLKKALLCRQEFSEAESNFITYMAGFSHHEFAESLFPHFNLSFLKDTSILFDRNNNKIHIKILINDQSHHCKKLSFGSIEHDYNSPIFVSRMAFRERNGLYIDSLGKQLRGCSGEQVRAYIAQGTSGIAENVVSYQRNLQGSCLVTHFVRATEPNVDINLKTVFSRVTASIFVDSMFIPLDPSPSNLSFDRFQNRQDIFPLLKSIYWYVLDIRRSKMMTDFLQDIEANFKLMPYAGEEHNYLQELLPEIETMVLECWILRSRNETNIT
jgi:hypothetical protein